MLFSWDAISLLFGVETLLIPVRLWFNLSSLLFW
jgi:hypothetical protein